MDPTMYRGYECYVNPHIPDPTVQVTMDHRFRGYPSGMMESPRIRHHPPYRRIGLPEPLPAAPQCRRTWSPPLGYPPPAVPPDPSARPDPNTSREGYSYSQWHPCSSLPKKHDLSETEIDAILQKHFELSKLRGRSPEEEHRKRGIMEQSLKNELKLDLSGDARDGEKHIASNNATNSGIDNKQPSPVRSPQKSPFKETSEKKAKFADEKKIGWTAHQTPVFHLNTSPPGSFPAFGTAGGGNPNVDKDGNRVAIIPGSSTVNRDEVEEKKKCLAAQMYNKEIERAILTRELMKIKEKQTQRSEPTETFVDKMHHSQTGKPRRHPQTGQLADQHLGSSDVTNFCNISPRHSYLYAQPRNDTRRYCTELERLAEDRKLRTMLDHCRERSESQKHFDSFDHHFGATLPDNLRKQKLMRLLYDPDFSKNEYRKPVTHNLPYFPNSTNFVKNNIGAHHMTCFEVPDAQQSLSPDDDYHLRSPFAHHDQ